HTAIAMLCVMAKRRLLCCPLRLPGSALSVLFQPPRLASGTGLRAAAVRSRGARLAAGGRPASAGRSHALRVPSDGVSNTRPIVLAGCGLLNTRRDTRLGVL